MKRFILICLLLCIFMTSCNLVLSNGNDTSTATDSNSDTNTSANTSTDQGVSSDTSTEQSTSSSTDTNQELDDSFFVYLEFYLNSDDEYEVKSLLDKSVTDIIIPSTYQGKPVTAIRPEAFMSEAITSVTIPSSIQTIGYYAFGDCNSLGYNEYESGLYLGNDENPYLVFVMPVSTDVVEITIHNETRFINGGAFMLCQKLTGVNFGSNIIEIGSWCFAECTSLATLTIPAGTKKLQSLVFYKCTSLTTVIIPSTVTTVSPNVFRRCDNLNVIVCNMPSQPQGFADGWNNTDAEVIWMPQE